MRKLTLTLTKLQKWTVVSNNHANRHNFHRCCHGISAHLVRPAAWWLSLVFWADRFGDQSRKPPVSLRLWNEGAGRWRGPVAPRHLHPSPGTRSPPFGTVSASTARRPCAVQPRAPGAGGRRAAARTARSAARAKLLRHSGPTFPHEPALGSLTWRVPAPGAGGARQVCDGSGERRLDGLAEGPQAARPGPAPRSRPLWLK